MRGSKRLFSLDHAINAFDSAGYTKLHKAVKKMDLGAVRYLLRAGADPNILTLDEHKLSCLHIATGFYRIIEKNYDFFRAVRFRRNHENLRFINSLFHQFKKNELEIVFALISYGANVNITSGDGLSPLRAAVFMGKEIMVKALIAAGSEFLLLPDNSENINWISCSIFDLALISNNYKMISFLIENYSIDLFDLSRNYCDLLEICSEEVLYLLGQHGLDFNLKNSYGRTFLHLLPVFSRADLLPFFIENDLDINARDNDGQTPLHKAVIFNDINLAIKLVRLGADINIRDKFRVSPTENAISLKRLSFIDYILSNCDFIDFHISYGLPGRTMIFLLRSYGEIELADRAEQKLLQQEIVNIDIIDKGGIPSLHYVCKKGYKDIARMILERGDDFEEFDIYNKTPLHYACQANNEEIVKMLIEKNATLNTLDASGKAPLDYAYSNGNIEIIKILLENRAIDPMIEIWHSDSVGPRLDAGAGGGVLDGSSAGGTLVEHNTNLQESKVSLGLY